MSNSKWKFTISYSNNVTGDVVQALQVSGFGILDSETIAEALLDTTELDIGIDKKSEIEPKLLLQNLKKIGLSVKWLNEPAA